MGFTDVKDFIFREDTTNGVIRHTLSGEKDEYITVIINDENIVVRFRGDDGRDRTITCYNMDYITSWQIEEKELGEN